MIHPTFNSAPSSTGQVVPHHCHTAAQLDRHTWTASVHASLTRPIREAQMAENKLFSLESG